MSRDSDDALVRRPLDEKLLQTVTSLDAESDVHATPARRVGSSLVELLLRVRGRRQQAVDERRLLGGELGEW